MHRRTSPLLVVALAAMLALVAIPSVADDTAASSGGTTPAAVATKVVGNGTPASCTPAALARAVRTGGNITFRCGSKPIVITLRTTLYTCNTSNCKHVWQGGTPVTAMTLDGGGKVTISGGDARGIFYANTCEESFGWIDAHCDTQRTPHITFKNITLANGNATKTPPGFDEVGGGGGGGAIAMRGGRLTVRDSKLINNRCMWEHSDAGGGAIRVVGQVETTRIFDSTLINNRCANGGAVSSLGAPLQIRDSVLEKNRATGHGASSGAGGNGGAVYFDGSDQDVYVERTRIKDNSAHEGGPGVFYVSNDRSGDLRITNSTVVHNTGAAFWTGSTTNLFWIARSFVRTGSTIE
ncbi:hypothetical protein [Cellulomonas composti]|uniref:Right handed beta helix domain-containing protein n=1 Tax=Cellulomonas composti TaxID=266130 RepID=A0A511J8R0_9CELL|nr:hypothetical protein [Cellulomonas composti]GEL94387.1 hypothetical protein CCO02nite_10450 [Cellulomonas composti]